MASSRITFIFTRELKINKGSGFRFARFDDLIVYRVTCIAQRDALKFGS